MTNTNTTTKQPQPLTLQCQKGTFKGSDGVVRDYVRYYVTVDGLDVKMEAHENLGKQLLARYYKGEKQ